MINYAVIGCGGISEVHCSAITSQKNSRLYTVCDIIPEKADKLGKKYNCKTSYNFNDILQNDKIDVVSLCLPHFKHVDFFEQALVSGKHVIIEKPLAIKYEDVKKMVLLSEQSDLKTTVAFQHRHSILIQKLKSFLDNGLIGEITGGEINFCCDRGMDYYNADDWRGKWSTEGGGTLITQAIHTIDLANVFLGVPVNVKGYIENREHPNIEVEDFAFGKVFYKDNKVLTIHAVNNGQKKWEPKLKVYGSKGSITLLGSDTLLELQTDNNEDTESIKSLHDIESQMKNIQNLPGKKCYGDLHKLVFEDFTKSIIEGREPLLSVKDASMANEIVLGFYNQVH